MNNKNLISNYDKFSQSVLTGDISILKSVLSELDEMIKSEASPYIKILLNFLKISYKRGFKHNPLSPESESFEKIRKDIHGIIGDQFNRLNLPFNSQIHAMFSYLYTFMIYFPDLSIIFSMPISERIKADVLKKYTAYDYFFKKTNFARYQHAWTCIETLIRLNKSINNLDVLTDFVRFMTNHGKISVFGQEVNDLSSGIFRADLEPLIKLYDRYLGSVDPSSFNESLKNLQLAQQPGGRAASKRQDATASSPFITLNTWGAKKYAGYNFSVGRTESEVFSLIFSPKSIELSTQFRSPQDTISDVSDKYILKKPLVYLLGNNSPNIKWREMFVPVLANSFIIYDPDVRTETHGREKRESDNLVSDIAILCADLIIIYIDYYNRNIDVMLETIFLITLGFPVILIVQDIQEGYYTESRAEINSLRNHIRKLADAKSIAVYESFSDFVFDNAVDNQYGQKVLSADSLMQTVHPDYISAGLDESIQPFLDDMEEKKIFDLKPEKIAGLFSRKPIYTSVIVDYEGTLVSQEKSFSFSVNNAITINEFFGTLNFMLFNRLGISDGNIELEDEHEKLIRNNFKTIKEDVKIQFLDLAFFDEIKSGSHTDEIKEFFESDDSTIMPQKFTHYIEIQLTMHFLIELLRKNMNIQYVTTKDYFNEIRKNNIVQNYFKNVIGEKDAEVGSLSDVDIFVRFAQSYIFELLSDVNNSRFTLNKLICLYPEILHQDTVRGLAHLCRFYNFEYEPRSGILSLDDNISYKIGSTSDVNLLVVLQEYFNELLKLDNKQAKQLIVKKQ
jgi:hypothetical protein